MGIRRINNGKIFSFGNDVIPKYSFNAKELDEETGMYYFEARYYKPPVFISRDPLMSEKPWLNPYHYCSNNPVGRIDPSGMFDDEAKANKYHQRAVKKYGSERVGGVYNAGTSENPDYQFRVYDKGKEKSKQWTKNDENGVSVCANKGNPISSGKEYRKYKHSQGNGILTVSANLTMGAQAGTDIKKGLGLSMNLTSVDLASIKYSTDKNIEFNHLNEYGETTHRMGISLLFIGYNYTKEPYQKANHAFGPTIQKSSIESFLGISKEGINISFGAAFIYGINVDINYKW